MSELGRVNGFLTAVFRRDGGARTASQPFGCLHIKAGAVFHWLEHNLNA